ncbi:DNA mismatch repair protein Mlh1 [Rhodosporidiobolus nylandii]
MASTQLAPPGAPRAIAKLPEHVVNRIAAGEIIQRPANALKELIENSLDAGATTIRVSVKEGGLKRLEIQDNGSGIRKDDLPILCERFTTSKIKAFEDLSSLGTYGFRGEALASISHVAHLSVTTKTRQESIAYKAAYADGQLVPVKAGSKDASPVPIAANDGTIIVVEDLFYNTPQRLKSLRSASDEYARIVQVVLAYSIHNAGVAMSCKKAASASSAATPDINTTVGASVLDNIGLHYGENVKRELLEVKVENETLNVKVKAWCSGANYQAKKGTYLFFINHRYVDCSSLKRALEAFYGTLLAKGTHPFVYLSLEIDPTKIDVNVHPTKKEVGFEDEDEIVELVCEKLAEALQKQGESRSYKVQTLLPNATTPKPSRTQSGGSSSSTGTPAPARKTSSSSKAKIAPNKLVRTDAQSQTLDALFPSLGSSSLSKSRSGAAAYIDDEASEAEEEGAGRPAKKRKVQSDHDPAFARQLQAEQAALARSQRVRIAQSECALTSVRQLRKEVIDGRHEGLDQIVKNHIFVGVADLDTWSMLQHQTKLYLVNHSALAEELFYQLGLRQFGRFSRVKLKPPPSLKKLIRLAVNRAEAQAQREAAGVTTSGEDIAEDLQRVYNTLFDARAMLDEYFSFTIDASGGITSLPLVLPGYSPDLAKLPLFLLRIGAHVNWEDEKPCFSTFLRELAFFYSPSSLPFSTPPPPPPSSIDATAGAAPPDADEHAAKEQRKKDDKKRTIQHVLFPAVKQYLVPPEGLLKRDIVLATSLENLYRVFERC